MEIMARRICGTGDGLILEYVDPSGYYLMNLWMSAKQFSDPRVYVNVIRDDVWLYFPPEVLLVG